MLRFDVHQHFLPAPVLDVLRARREPPRLAGRSLELREGSFPFDERAHDLGERLALLDRDGIDVAVISLAPTLETEDHPELRDAYHEGMLDVVDAAGGRLRALAAGECLPRFAGACVSAGAVVGGLGDLLHELADAHGVLFVHPGPPASPVPGAPPWWTACADYTAQMQAAYFSWIAGGAAYHPSLQVVFAILAGGAPFQIERLASRGMDAAATPAANVHLDTASYGRRALALCLETVGAAQLVYGSDVPVVDSAPTLRALESLGRAVLDTVSCENPARLFA
ncbi:MAG: amidohydrolase family protein [Gaiellaceae bacterium]